MKAQLSGFGAFLTHITGFAPTAAISPEGLIR